MDCQEHRRSGGHEAELRCVEMKENMMARESEATGQMYRETKHGGLSL
jgi:hypothetical protein